VIVVTLVLALPVRLPLRKARTHEQQEPQEAHSYCYRVVEKLVHCQFLASCVGQQTAAESSATSIQEATQARDNEQESTGQLCCIGVFPSKHCVIDSVHQLRSEVWEHEG